MPADRRKQLQALADWIVRGPTPERVRLAAMLRPPHTSQMEWRWDMLASRMTETYPDGLDEWDRCLDALEAIAEHRRSPYMIPLHYRHRIEDARRWRLAARAAGWRLP